jgi:hypothetical protein
MLIYLHHTHALISFLFTPQNGGGRGEKKSLTRENYAWASRRHEKVEGNSCLATDDRVHSSAK